MNLTEAAIQHAVFTFLHFERKHTLIVPNARELFTTGECDVLSLTKKLRAFEWEIKTSKADFRNDAKKRTDKDGNDSKYDLFRQRKAGNTEYTHRSWTGTAIERARQFPLTTPNYFNYVVPEDLITVDDLPEFAGLYYVAKDLTRFREIRKPVLIHDEPIAGTVVPKLGIKLMHRFWNERKRLLTKKTI